MGIISTTWLCWIMFNRNREYQASPLPRLPDLTFATIDEENETFAVSAYLEEYSRKVRVFALKKDTAAPLVYCFYWGNTFENYGKPVWNSAEVFAFERLKYAFRQLGAIQPTESYGAYVTFCRVPSGMMGQIVDGKVGIALHVGTASYKPPVVLQIHPGQVVEKKDATLDPTYRKWKPPRKVGLCVAPIYDLGVTVTTSYLVSYIELYRVTGVSLMVFYIVPEVIKYVQPILDSYANKLLFENGDKFELLVLTWQPPLNEIDSQLEESDEILGYNDCIYRISREVEYILHANLKEIVLPKQNPNSIRLTEWSNVIRVLRDVNYAKRPTTCFPARYFPPIRRHLKTTESIFERVWATRNLSGNLSRCITHSGEVFDVDIHAPITPPRLNNGTDLATVLIFDNCDADEITTCTAENALVINEELTPYLSKIQPSIERRMAQLESQFK
ncbi:hypothetical protein T265_11009 [Opisthorchis viverrini]|uniref:Glycosyltransferase family 92 protein n=2 Tax=Opisthorchis viverrini TaxID=6198 RepID=A0A074Z4J4_OPIVI|nr:hypothetical protein T265_11009 [Opisthorchis viverrini]KER20447.1 hypothetical protein T265_11009 [Opisthorchis viverrini]